MGALKTPRILFTGGGSAGHVSVNLALIPDFRQQGWEMAYMGSYQGIEAQLIGKLPDVRYIGISTGKMRRYMDLNNIKDPFRVVAGVWQAYREIRKWKPDVVFSKGGFVSVPVVLAARMNNVPVVIHESDMTPGLANKIAMPFSRKICYTFPETAEHVDAKKSLHVGGIIREQLRSGQASRGLNMCNFTKGKPVILVTGGSLGSRIINQTLRQHLPELLQHYQIVHLCGKNQRDVTWDNRQGYAQFEYVDEEMADLLAMTDLVISRAGSNSIFECLALQKPMLLIPLSRRASRGDQLLNAASFARLGYCEVLEEEQFGEREFVEAIGRLQQRKDEIRSNMEQAKGHSQQQLVALIIEQRKK